MSKPSENPPVELAEIRERLASATAPEYWRSLEEAAGTDAFREYLHREFPDNAADLADPESRRSFLKVMGASLALAGVSGCAIRTPEKIVPWVKAPENVVPGRPQFFASTMAMNGLGTGILVESHSGRPTKIEGNPDHPASLGSTDIYMQAATLSLYDPDRSKVVLHEGQVDTWDNFLESITETMNRFRQNKGAGLRLLTGAVGSPSLAGQIKELLAAFPEARWHRYDAVNKDAARLGSKLAFGEYVDSVYRFDKADVIVALDADFLACGSPGRVADERAFSARRAPKEGVMNRLYVAEAPYTNTGAAADHRLPIRSSLIPDLTLAIAKELGVEGSASINIPGLNAQQTKWAGVIARDLKAHRGKALVLVGDGQPAYVHALGHAINASLGNVGPEGTVTYIEPIEADPVEHIASLGALVAEIRAGKVDTLVIFGGNPGYDAPVEFGTPPADPKKPDGLTPFARTLAKVPNSIRLGLHDDETSPGCSWHINEAHFLESWGDARAFDGTASIIQPMIAPLYGGKTAHEILSAMMGQFERTSLKVVQEYWKGQKGASGDFEKTWRAALHSGKVDGTVSTPRAVAAKSVASFGARPAPAGGQHEILFRPCPNIWDGRFANNGWLQELPRPITKLTWDNAALMSFATAEKEGYVKDQMISLRFKGRTLEAPVYIVPGQAEGSIVVHLGYGRTRAGQIGTGPGFNAYEIRTADAPWGGSGLEINPDGPTGRTYNLVTTQMVRNLEGRDLVRAASLADFIKDPSFAHANEHHEVDEKGEQESLTALWEYDSYKWGMAIDLNSCTGCNACVVSCVAENNIPVIGKEQMAVGRNMQWIEIDTYFHSPQGKSMEETDTYFQPRTCMHCENAPCELVCPVAATVHDAEGLNVMVYNRCVGTRYCGNNCPYKVRHFNFLDYADLATPQFKLLNNPDVTVRSRGVMEKCTYCTQRISAKRIDSKEKGKRIEDGDVVTACQAACPAQAIHFGDLNDKKSKVYQIKQEKRDYEMLGELNVRPRTTYLAKIRNYNPELVEA